MKKIVCSFRTVIGLLIVFTVLLGGVYPLIVTAIAQGFMKEKADGSLIENNGVIIGSKLLGQEFVAPKYFWGRLSATTPAYNAANSSGSNFSPANPKLLDAANARIAALHKADPKNKAKIPVDLITASGSGLDPDISLLAAEYQMERVAAARKLSVDDVHALIIAHVEGQGKFEHMPYVNVLELNLALDALKQ